MTHKCAFRYKDETFVCDPALVLTSCEFRGLILDAVNAAENILAMSEQTPAVRMKGIGNRLWLTIDSESPYELIEDELVRLFDPIREMARGARVVLDAGGGEAAQALAARVGGYLKETFGLEEVEAPPAKDAPPAEHTELLRDWRSVIPKRPGDTLVMAGRVRSGQTVTAKNHLIILGDVNPGSEITAGGDILVLGSLGGTAAAGQPENTDAIILAFDFRPIQIKIGGVVAAGSPPGGSSAIEFAHVENNTIIVEDYVAANPFKKLTWPVVR